MMAIPVTTPNAVDLYSSLRSQCGTLKNVCARITAGVGASGAKGSDLVALLAVAAGTLATYGQIGGATSAMANAIQTYVQGLYGDSTLTVTSDAQASATALEALIAAVPKDLPTSGPIERSVSSAGVVADVLYTSAQLGNTLPAINAWLATIS